MEKNPTKRIEYIDALRGFSMYLVVYSHIWTFCYHNDDSNSFAHILTNFFLILFFFISGFFAYKKDYNYTFLNVLHLLKTKAIQLLCPAIFFCTLFCWWGGYGLDAALSPSNAGYWFTIHLFYFFVFYFITNLISSKTKVIRPEFILILIALFIYCISYSHVIIERTQLGTNLFYYLGVKNWRYYIFFCIGVLIKKHFFKFEKLTDQPYLMAFFILGFFFMVFYADSIAIPLCKPIIMLVYGVLSIIVIFSFFRKYKSAFNYNTKLGYILQFIGRRTIDVYMIHYFLLPRNLDVVGVFFTRYINPSIEFVFTTIIALLVILLSIIIGSLIRLSPFLSHYLLGNKNPGKISANKRIS